MHEAGSTKRSKRVTVAGIRRKGYMPVKTNNREGSDGESRATRRVQEGGEKRGGDGRSSG